MSQYPVLYVEDNADDVLLLRHAFKRADILDPVQFAQDGQEAIDYLAGAGKFSDRKKYPMPRLVLLDLKLPKKTGIEVLQWIREQPALRKLPVIILSASAQKSDVGRCYELGVNAFLVKPSSIDTLGDMCRAIQHFWLTYNVFPQDGSGAAEPIPKSEDSSSS